MLKPIAEGAKMMLKRRFIHRRFGGKAAALPLPTRPDVAFHLAVPGRSSGVSARRKATSAFGCYSESFRERAGATGSAVAATKRPRNPVAITDPLPACSDGIRDSRTSVFASSPSELSLQIQSAWNKLFKERLRR